MTSIPPKLVIFDCDGVLVDSEPLSLDVLVRVLRNAGVDMDAEEATERFLGKSLKTMTDILHEDYGLAVDDHFLEADAPRPLPALPAGVAACGWYRRRRSISSIFRGCVASSSQMERIRLSLTITGLIDKLEPHLFSSTHGQARQAGARSFPACGGAKWRRRRKTASSSKTARPASRRPRRRACGFLPLPAPRMRSPSGICERSGGFRPDVLFDDMRELIHFVRKEQTDGNAGL